MASRRVLLGDRLTRVAARVSTIELLFDLVFVFTISRVTEIVIHHPDLTGVGQAAVILALVWWMYDAYAWLTNQAVPDTTWSRIALIAAMAGFLVMSIAIPDAFGATGVLFGSAYIAVSVIHAALFVLRGGEHAARRMLMVGSGNILVGVLLVAAGAVEGPLDWLLFTLPFLAFLGSAVLSARGGFDPGAAHMVERHGLLMIIAFGESIVSVGIGASEHVVEGSIVIGTVLAVGVVAALWWCYFAGDDQRAEDVMQRLDARSRTRLALTAFYLLHLAMIFGLVLLAAGLHELLVDSLAPVSWPSAGLIAAGASIYLFGDAAYRRTLRLGSARWRSIGGIVVAATASLGAGVSGAAQLLAMLAIVVGLLVAESNFFRGGAA